MGETLFSLAFDIEAVIPIEIGVPTYCITKYVKANSELALRSKLDLLEEKRNHVELKNVVYKQRRVWYYNSKVRSRRF